MIFSIFAFSSFPSAISVWRVAFTSLILMTSRVSSCSTYDDTERLLSFSNMSSMLTSLEKYCSSSRFWKTLKMRSWFSLVSLFLLPFFTNSLEASINSTLLSGRVPLRSTMIQVAIPTPKKRFEGSWMMVSIRLFSTNQ